MQSLRREPIPQGTFGQFLPQSCAGCVNDAGFQSGMAGAARCGLIEQSALHAEPAGSLPPEWRMGRNGTLSCSAFAPDLDW